MKVGLLTDKGRRRKNNEDYIRTFKDINLFMLADGVGGNRSGEVASKETVETFGHYIKLRIDKTKEEYDIIKLLEEAIKHVNDKLYLQSNNKQENLGMATTFIYVLIKDGIAYMGNIGDSRGYLVHENQIIQITDDHTYVNELVKAGLLTKLEARDHTKKNIITRAIGAEKTVKEDLFTLPVVKNDILMLCSDGLYDELEDEVIMEVMNKYKDMQTCANKLIERANKCGGNDNISVICIKIMEDKHE